MVERERRVGRRERGRVVPEGRRGVAVLHEVARRPREGVAAHEPRRLGDAVHALARLGGELEGHLAGADLGADHEDAEPRHDVLEGSLARVHRQQGHQPVIDGRRTSPFVPSATPFASRPSPGVWRRVWWRAMRSSTWAGAYSIVIRSKLALTLQLGKVEGRPQRSHRFNQTSAAFHLRRGNREYHKREDLRHAGAGRGDRHTARPGASAASATANEPAPGGGSTPRRRARERNSAAAPTTCIREGIEGGVGLGTGFSNTYGVGLEARIGYTFRQGIYAGARSSITRAPSVNSQSDHATFLGGELGYKVFTSRHFEIRPYVFIGPSFITQVQNNPFFVDSSTSFAVQPSVLLNYHFGAPSSAPTCAGS